MNFWQKLKKPFFVLAPMANVTDCVFRKMIAKYGKPDVMWTEFVSANGLLSPGRKRLLVDLQFSKKERPIVAQLFSGNSEAMRLAAQTIVDLGFDGLDINTGCPDRSIERQGGGASLIKRQDCALDIIKSAREGVLLSLVKKKRRKEIPVSVKTRIGYSKIDLEWVKLLLEQKLPALTIHLRTRKEMSQVKAHWEVMPEIIRMRNEISPETLIIGNGDVNSIEEAKEKCREYGCDGIMIGRGIFGKPWFFSKKKYKESIENKLKVLLEHTKIFEKTFKGIKNFDVMKKHFKAYVSGWKGAKELRIKLMQTKNYKEVKEVVDKYEIDNK